MYFKQEYLFFLAGLILLIIAVMTWRDRSNPKRLTTGLFWFIYSLLFILGDWLAALDTTAADADEARKHMHMAAGALVLILSALAAFGGLGLGRHPVKPQRVREAYARRLGNQLFIPALIIPFGTMAGVLLFKFAPGLKYAVLGPARIKCRPCRRCCPSRSAFWRRCFG